MAPSTALIVGAIFGLALGLSVAGTIARAQCCAMLDVPLNHQIEIEHQREEWSPAPHTNQGAWREMMLDKPCR